MDYLDFELEIDSKGGEYSIKVRSPAGEASETTHLPFEGLELQNELQNLKIALLSSRGTHRRVLSPEQQKVQGFGRALFDSLLKGEVRSRYDASRQQVVQQGKGLRLKLCISSPEWAALPWEFLYDARQGEYACLSRDTPLVRYLKLPSPLRPLTVTPPLRILGMVVSPSDLPPLKVGVERQRVDEAIQDLQARGLVTLTWLEGQTWRDLQGALRRGPWHVFHFVGHGGFDSHADEGLVAFADEQGKSHYLVATQLGRLLANHGSLRLVLLNSCEGAMGGTRDIFSSTASILVQRGLPAVLAMQYEISDEAAIEMAHTFYEALADGYPVDAALVEARTAISLAATNTVEWGTPVLYMRAPDGVLFDIQAQDVAAVQKAREEAMRKAQEEAEAARKAHEEQERETARLAAAEAAAQKAREDQARREQEEAEAARKAEAAAKRKAEAADKRKAEEKARLAQEVEAAAKEAAARQEAEAAAKPVAAPEAEPKARKGRGKAAEASALPQVLKPAHPFEPELVLVPAGEFLMGSDGWGADDSEKPQHKLHLPDYYMAKTPVTNAQYAVFVEKTGHAAPAHWKGRGFLGMGSKQPPEGKENHPVENVTWHDAVAYCRWLADLTGRAYYLPSEAEWEKAARGTDGRIYPWGNDWDASKCNTGGSGNKGTTPVEAYPGGASPYGCLDMVGNVLEWTRSLWGTLSFFSSKCTFKYPYALNDGRENLNAGNDFVRVLRGGSWWGYAEPARCARRNSSNPDVPIGGFRVMVSPVSNH